ncbi:M42 family metallopeptidase [Fervidobacterium pennivorans subsp. carthaginiensis]|uniref:M42 family metallopeptidase n=1 Tax=Fervidobacterium pennivorans TaxID=93466 RepID=UPI001BC87B09|nr:M42 family metallopeptidase [Fervidobacterium pennivorans]
MKRRLFDHSELIELCEVPGVSGREERVREKISVMLGVEKSKLQTDKIGNLIFEKEGLANEKEVLLMAHMDEIGFYVSSLRSDGKLEVKNVGGIIEETLPGSFVQVFTKTGVVDGVIGAVPPHLKADGVAFEKVVDVGAKNRDELVELGIDVMDFVVFRKTFALLNNDYLAMRSLDDRFGCFTLIEVSRGVNPRSKVVFAWTVQEEVGLRGAKALASIYNPDLAIAIDSFACCSKQNAHIELGKGPVIRAFDNSSISNYEVAKFIVSLANKEGIPIQIGTTGGGNDASVFVEKGVPMIALSVPVRYLHSQVEMINLNDLENLIKLLTKFLEVF